MRFLCCVRRDGFILLYKNLFYRSGCQYTGTISRQEQITWLHCRQIKNSAKKDCAFWEFAKPMKYYQHYLRELRVKLPKYVQKILPKCNPHVNIKI